MESSIGSKKNTQGQTWFLLVGWYFFSGIEQTSFVLSRVVRVEYVESFGSHSFGYEHGSVVHESARVPNAGPPGKFKFRFGQHQYRTGRMRMVRSALRTLDGH